MQLAMLDHERHPSVNLAGRMECRLGMQVIMVFYKISFPPCAWGGKTITPARTGQYAWLRTR